jgi:hypothetical protein
LASVLPSLILVWPSNCGSASLTLTIAASPFAGVLAGEVGVLLLEDLLFRA